MNIIWQKIVATTSIVLLLLLSTIVASAQDDTSAVSDDEVNQVASQLFCPTCESVPVDVCPTEVCSDWRNEIRAQLEAGKEDQEILAYFATRYGNGVLANPRAEGFGLLIWLAPIIVLLGALIWFARYMSNLQTTTKSDADFLVVPPLSQDKKTPADLYRQQLENELNKPS